MIIVGSPEWEQRIDLVAADPITGFDDIAYSVHFYAATHGSYLRDRTRDALDSGLAIFVTESSGSEASGLGANDYTEYPFSSPDPPGQEVGTSRNLRKSGEYIRARLRMHCP